MLRQMWRHVARGDGLRVGGEGLDAGARHIDGDGPTIGSGGRHNGALHPGHAVARHVPRPRDLEYL